MTNYFHKKAKYDFNKKLPELQGVSVTYSKNTNKKKTTVNFAYSFNKI